MNDPRVALVQDGSRGHYGLALALREAGILNVMYTDFFIKPGGLWDRLTPLLRRLGPMSVRRMLDRRAPALRGVTVRSSLLRRLRQDSRRHTFRSESDWFRWQSADWAAWIAARLDPTANILMGFIRHIDPGLCREARRRGLLTIGDQMIAPALVEVREAIVQQQRFPGWELPSIDELQRGIEIETATWPELDAITCPSEYVAAGLIDAGVPADRVHVVHYPIDEERFQFVDRSQHRGPVRVGFVGQVNLRKGTPYFVQVARRFPREQVQFTLLGRAYLTDSAIAEVRRHVEVFPVVRSQVAAHLATFDCIYFPTTCEGSPYALMEAMASGLPVVTSPNAGSIVRHGVDGFICAYDDVEGASAYVERLVRDQSLRLQMGLAARERYSQFGLARYACDMGLICRQTIAKSGASISA